ncbi:hypothetical protein AB1Y20_012150 [Prymnesium parvum]|uniref:Holocytochrome c-type synthase n=1 Tax=Prymnesium parvum TaxID=97485 RepID=A0AB34INQ4_PRYPA
MAENWFPSSPPGAPSPAWEHQFGNPDTKHGKPGQLDRLGASPIRSYVPGYSGHVPVVQEKIGGGAWKPSSPYKLEDEPRLVETLSSTTSAQRPLHGTQPTSNHRAA